MDRSRLFSLALVGLFAAAALPARAQDQSQTPAQTPAATPNAQASSDSATQPAPKKVWTNEDVPVLREDSSISTVGKRQNGQHTSANANRPAPATKDGKAYAAQITELQKKLEPINDQIAQLQSGIDGKFTGDGQKSTRPASVHADDWRDLLARLEKQRDDINARIDSIRDQARRAGVAPNTLP
jgi:hypothetical protein